MTKYCCSSPWCEEDVCRCDQWEEEETKRTGKISRRSDWELFLVGVFLVLLLVLAIACSL